MALSDNKKKRKLYVRITTVIFLLTLIITLIFPLKYSANTSVLVIQKGDISLDQYEVSDFSEKLALNLSEAVYTSTFFYQTMDTGYDVSPELFAKDEASRKKQWERTINTKVKRGTGILEIEVFHQSSYTARELANAVAYALTLNGQQYTGLQNTDIKVIDAVAVSKIPVKPNLLLVALLGLVLGLAVSFSANTLIEEKKAKTALQKGKVKDEAEKEKTVSELIENSSAEQAFEQSRQGVVKVPSYSQYAYFPEEILEVMPRQHGS